MRGEDRKLALALVVHALVTLLFVDRRPLRRPPVRVGLRRLCLTLVAIPLIGSKDFQGLGRYLLAAFPVFALAGEALAERPILRRAVLPVAAAMLVVGTAGFAHGLYLA